MNPRSVIRFSVLATLSSLLTIPVSAQLTMDLQTVKTLRQTSSTAVVFRDGYFRMQLTDGTFFYGCGNALEWFAPSLVCPLGATGYVSTGAEAGSWGSPDLGTYWEVSAVTAAAVVEPFEVPRISLIAAPASTLPRPQAPFEDASFSMFYDIGVKSVDVSEYRICNYAFRFEYGLVDEDTGDVIPSGSEEARMDAEIVPGIYQFSFPKLGNPSTPVNLAPRYYVIPEGYRIRSNQKIGMKFDYPNTFGADGFALINSADLKNPVKWQGITATNAYAGFDKLYFSVKELADPVDPNSESLSSALFPAFTSPTSPTRILLKNPYINSYLLPPTIPTLAAGKRGVIELELIRSATVGGVIYDASSRRYQIPVHFGDHYEIYQKKTFKSGALLTGPADDFDADGFINASEWILNSSAASAKSIPKAPTPKSNRSGGTTGSYYGFNIRKNVQAVPAVAYAIQRSANGGAYAPIAAADPGWRVVDSTVELRIESKKKDARGNQIAPDSAKTDKFKFVITVP